MKKANSVKFFIYSYFSLFSIFCTFFGKFCHGSKRQFLLSDKNLSSVIFFFKWKIQLHFFADQKLDFKLMHMETNIFC